MNTPALMSHHHTAAHGAIAEDPLHQLGGQPDTSTYEGKTLEHFFVTTDHGIKKWDTTKFEDFADTVLGIRAPFAYYLKNGAKDAD